MNKRISRNGIDNIAREYSKLYKTLEFSVEENVFNTMVFLLAEMLEKDNEKFDKKRFSEAIYGKQEVE